MTANISPCGQYRYTLERRVSMHATRAVLFVMLNPSTADARTNDATIRRCIGFAAAWGYGSLLVGNLFAYRATDPRELAGVADPVGPENDAHLVELILRAYLIVCAWGAHPEAAARADDVRALFGGRPCYHLGQNDDGSPRHPLRLRRDTRPELWT